MRNKTIENIIEVVSFPVSVMLFLLIMRFLLRG